MKNCTGMQNAEEKEDARRRRKNEGHDVGKHSESLANEHGSNRVRNGRNGRKGQWEQPGFQARWKS